MRFFASAPCKAILFGEHYVVYGSPALSLAIEPRNTVSFSGASGEGMALCSSLGSGRILQDGSFIGSPQLGIYSAVAKEIFRGKPVPPCKASFAPSWGMKGVGTSASLGAAFAAGLLKLAGERQTPARVFFAAQAGDAVAHDGKASGIDAKTVSEGKPLVFRKEFSPVKFTSRKSAFRVPAGSSLIIIDTFSGRKDGTAAMLANFARSFKIKSLPNDTSADERKGVQGEFAGIWSSLHFAKTARSLGFLMNENHSLLRARGVSGKSIEKAVSSALTHGAYGAKLTGGGGEGGAVIALCDGSKAGRFAKGIKNDTGFMCRNVSLAKKGACAD